LPYPVKTDTLVFKSPDEVHDEAEDLVSVVDPSNAILSSGCSIRANAPPEKIEAMVRLAK
jgi:uroporphyrinogen-III decarboxylase